MGPDTDKTKVYSETFPYAETLSRGLLYTRTISDIAVLLRLTMYVDSDYAAEPDTHRFRAGFLIYLNKNLISFNSQLQRGTDLDKHYPDLKLPSTPMDGEPMPSMATATCGAEYMAVTDNTRTPTAVINGLVVLLNVVALNV